MKIQSLSVVVPSKGCINQCRFCVSRMHNDDYPNQLDEKLPFYDLYEADYIKRLEFARDNGCNTVMLTGNCEPQQNRSFLERFGTMNRNLPSPFRWIEMQTTGTMLNDSYLRFLRNHVGVSTISVYVASFDDTENNDIIRTLKNESMKIRLYDLAHAIKKYDFNLRLSINLTSAFNGFGAEPQKLFDLCKKYKADQVTLREMYKGNDESEQSKWLDEHMIDHDVSEALKKYIFVHGHALERLEYGRIKFSVDGISTVVDDDCMAQELSDSYKYLILRPNCKLYSRWNDQGSLVF